MKKIFATIALILILTFGCYIFYKRYTLNKYIFHNETYNNFLKGLDNRTYTRIDSNKNNNDTDYISIDKLSLKNDYKDFTRVDQGNNSLIGERYVLYDENGTFTASISFGKDYLGKIEMIKAQDAMDKKAWRAKYLKELKIEDDVDLLNYLISIKDQKYNFFSKIKNIKGDYEIHSILSNYALGSEITFFTGDLVGYMTKINDKTKEAFILKNGQSYYITFQGLDYFNENRIRDVLENLKIED